MTENKDFKCGDKVSMDDNGITVTGEVTIVTHNTCKVIWDSPSDLDYWYYDKKDLRLINDTNSIKDKT